MKVYFVRHGESEGNRKLLRQGSEEPLSSDGRMQALALARRAEALTIDRIYSSDFVRAHETAKEIEERIGKRIILSPLLREVKQPSELIGLHIHSDESIRAHEAKHANEHDPNWHLSDEENFFDAAHRAKEALKLFVQEGHEHVLAVTHSLFMYHLAATILFPLGLAPKEFRQFSHSMQISNTGITLCEYKPEADKWKLVSWNDSAHLS